MDTDKNGYARIFNMDIAVDTETPALLAERNGGAYLLVINLACKTELPLVRIGSPVLKPGWYIYTGSARTNLRLRIPPFLFY